MKTRAAALSLAVALAALSAPAAMAAATTAQKTFITKAIEGNLAEVQIGQLAQQQGGSDQVKSFAQTLVNDHQANNDEAMKVAQDLGVTAPKEPGAEEMKTMKHLQTLKGAEFDKAFAAAMVKDHRRTIAEFEKAAKMKGPEGQYAEQTLPGLKKHLQEAEKLEKSGS